MNIIRERKKIVFTRKNNVQKWKLTNNNKTNKNENGTSIVWLMWSVIVVSYKFAALPPLEIPFLATPWGRLGDLMTRKF